jgi:hypothetical protein
MPELLHLRQQNQKQFEPAREMVRGYQVAIDGSVRVQNRPGHVWVKDSAGNVRPVFNPRVADRPNLPVVMQPDRDRNNELMITDVDWGNISRSQLYDGSPFYKNHAADHEWRSGYPGADALTVYPQAWAELRTAPYQDLQISVSALRYFAQGTPVAFKGGVYDLASYQPTSGLARLVLVYLDTGTNTIDFAAGNTGTDNPLLKLPAPTVPGAAIPSAYVRLSGDATALAWQHIFNARSFLNGADNNAEANWQHVNMMSGRIWGGYITDNGDGTVAISAGQGLVKDEDAGPEDVPASYHDGQASRLSEITWEAVAALACTDEAYNYIYYDGSDGQLHVTTDFYSISFTQAFTLGRVYRSGTEITIRLCGTNLWNFDRRVQLFGEEVFPVVKAKGLVPSESGTRGIAVTAGVLWAELVNRFSIDAIDTAAASTFAAWYRNGSGGWTRATGQTQINNTNYDDGSGTLATLTANRYGVHWLYVVHDGNLHAVYGQGDYTLAQADAAGPPATLPGLLAAYASLVGKVTVQKSATNLYSVEQPDSASFSSGAVADHGALAGLSDDDHPQYHNDARGDARYTPIAHASNTSNPHSVTLAQVGGDTLDAGKVSKLWESDGGAVAWQTDASGNLSGGAGLDITLQGASGGPQSGTARDILAGIGHILDGGHPANVYPATRNADDSEFNNSNQAENNTIGTHAGGDFWEWSPGAPYSATINDTLTPSCLYILKQAIDSATARTLIANISTIGEDIRYGGELVVYSQAARYLKSGRSLSFKLIDTTSGYYSRLVISDDTTNGITVSGYYDNGSGDILQFSDILGSIDVPLALTLYRTLSGSNALAAYFYTKIGPVKFAHYNTNRSIRTMSAKASYIPDKIQITFNNTASYTEAWTIDSYRRVL